MRAGRLHGACELEHVEAALGTSALRYGRDDHYDVVERVHQVDARVGSRRRRVLAGPDARSGRGRPVHRPAHGDLRERGRRARRLAQASRSPSPPRTPSNTSGSPRRSSTWRRRRFISPRRPRATAPRWRSGMPAPPYATVRPARCPRTCAMPTIRALLRSATVTATSILTTMTPAGSHSSICPTPLVGRRWYEPSTHGDGAPRGRTDGRAHEGGVDHDRIGELVVVLAAVLLSIGFAALDRRAAARARHHPRLARRGHRPARRDPHADRRPADLGRRRSRNGRRGTPGPRTLRPRARFGGSDRRCRRLDGGTRRILVAVDQGGRPRSGRLAGPSPGCAARARRSRTSST